MLACLVSDKPIGALDSNRSITISIDPTQESEATLFQSKKLIRLESNDSNLIGQVRKISITKERIFIADNAGIFVFDYTGKLISKVKRLGRGPGEYQTLTDFELDTVNNVVEIMDNISRKILRYKASGLFISESSIPLVAVSYTKLGENFLFFSGNEINGLSPFSLNQTSGDINFTIEASYFPINIEEARYLHIKFPYHFYYFKDSIRFFKPLNDTIYDIQDRFITPKYIIDFGEKRVNREQLLNRPIQNIIEFFSILKSNEYAFNVANVTETGTHLLFTYHYQEKTFHVVFNKLNGKVTQSSKRRFDYFGSLSRASSIDNFPKGSFNDQFIEVLESYEFISTIDSLKKSLSGVQWSLFESESHELLKFYENAKVGDNPILIFSTLNEQQD